MDIKQIDLLLSDIMDCNSINHQNKYHFITEDLIINFLKENKKYIINGYEDNFLLLKVLNKILTIYSIKLERKLSELKNIPFACYYFSEQMFLTYLDINYIVSYFNKKFFYEIVEENPLSKTIFSHYTPRIYKTKNLNMNFFQFLKNTKDHHFLLLLKLSLNNIEDKVIEEVFNNFDTDYLVEENVLYKTFDKYNDVLCLLSNPIEEWTVEQENVLLNIIFPQDNITDKNKALKELIKIDVSNFVQNNVEEKNVKISSSKNNYDFLSIHNICKKTFPQKSSSLIIDLSKSIEDYITDKFFTELSKLSVRDFYNLLANKIKCSSIDDISYFQKEVRSFINNYYDKRKLFSSNDNASTFKVVRELLLKLSQYEMNDIYNFIDVLPNLNKTIKIVLKDEDFISRFNPNVKNGNFIIERNFSLYKKLLKEYKVELTLPSSRNLSDEEFNKRAKEILQIISDFTIQDFIKTKAFHSLYKHKNSNIKSLVYDKILSSIQDKEDLRYFLSHFLYSNEQDYRFLNYVYDKFSEENIAEVLLSFNLDKNVLLEHLNTLSIEDKKYYLIVYLHPVSTEKDLKIAKIIQLIYQ